MMGRPRSSPRGAVIAGLAATVVILLASLGCLILAARKPSAVSEAREVQASSAGFLF